MYRNRYQINSQEPHERRSWLPSFKRSKVLRTSASLAAASLITIGSLAGGIAPSQAALPNPDTLNEAYEKAAAALEKAANPSPTKNPLADLMPQAGGDLETSIKDLQSDLKDYFPSLTKTNPNDPNLINQNPASTTTAALNVTVAKSVLVSADPSGDPNLSVLLASTQVSGNGAATVKVPMGTESARNSNGFRAPTMLGDSIVYDDENSDATIQNFSASNGSYDGDLPIRVDVDAWLDGAPIEPQDMVNVTGNVKLNYTFSNLTAESTQISFKGPDGRLITQTKSVPIPFGGAFLITLPSTFADINAPWAQGGVSPLGTTLSGTVMMIPPIGALSQTLTINARAKEASLPSSSFQALPVTLTDQGMGRMLFDALPLAGDITNVATAATGFGAADIVKLQAIVLKYGAIAEGLSKQYLRPFIQAFENGQIDKAVALGEDQLKQLDDGAQQLGLLLPQAQKVIGLVDTAVTVATNTLENNLGNIDKALALLKTASETLDGALPTIDATFANIEKYLPQAVSTGLTVAKAADTVCEKTQSFVDYLGPTEANVVAVLRNIATLISGVWPSEAAKLNALADTIENYFKTVQDDLATCIKYSDEAIKYLTEATVYMPQILGGLQILDNAIHYAAGLVDQGVITADQFVKVTLPKLLVMLDNNNCQKTPADISKCGIKQQMTFLNQMMILAATTVNNQMVPGLDAVVKYIPTINKFVLLADKYIPIFGKKLEAMIPKAVSGAEGGLDKALVAVDKFGTYAATAQITVASYTAQLEIMNARAQSGQGLPAGPAQGANTNLGAYQYQLAGASDQGRQNAILFGSAALLLMLSVGVGTFLYGKSR